MPNLSQPKSWRDVLPIHPAAELFPRMSESELRELGTDIKKNGMTSPMLLWPGDDGKYSLLDGRNRLDAMELVGIETVGKDGKLPKQIAPGIYDALGTAGVEQIKLYKSSDPYNLVLSLNIHRRHLTAEQKRELIAKLIKQTPNKSDRRIAKQTKTSPTTVGKIRKQSETAGDVSKLDTRTDTKGRKQPSTKPIKPAKLAASAKTDPIGSPPVRYSKVPATSVSRLSETAHFLINEVSRRLKEARPKLSTCDYAAVCTTIRALVDADDIVGETLRLIEKMTPAQRQDFVARLQRGELVVACRPPQGSAEIPIEQRKAEHAALDKVSDDLLIPACLRRVAP